MDSCLAAQRQLLFPGARGEPDHLRVRTAAQPGVWTALALGGTSSKPRSSAGLHAAALALPGFCTPASQSHTACMLPKFEIARGSTR